MKIIAVILICILIYIISFLIIRFTMRYLYKQGCFRISDAIATISWFIPILNSIIALILIIGAAIDYFGKLKIFKYTNNPLIQYLTNRDLYDGAE